MKKNKKLTYNELIDAMFYHFVKTELLPDADKRWDVASQSDDDDFDVFDYIKKEVRKMARNLYKKGYKTFCEYIEFRYDSEADDILLKAINWLCGYKLRNYCLFEFAEGYIIILIAEK